MSSKSREMMISFLEIKYKQSKKVENRNRSALQAYQAKRTSSFFHRRLNGSMTVEAAFIIPFFLFFMVNMFAILLSFGAYSKTLSMLHQQGKHMAILAHGSESGEEMVNLTKVQEIAPMVPLIAFPTSYTVVSCNIRKWNGYDAAAHHGTNQEEEWVYIAESGEVYHRSRGCRYLNPTIHCASIDSISGKRNRSGEKYTKCRTCGWINGLDLVYITENGNRYHKTLQCSGLKRTVRSVPISKVGGRRPCSKCG